MNEPMDEKTLTALQGSIAKWQAIVDGTGHDAQWENCPLCIVFMEKYGGEDDPAHYEDGCLGCPVAAKVSAACCSNTPYANWSDYFYEKFGVRIKAEDRKPFDDKSRELAQAELDFLRSLLPKEPA